MSNTNTIISLPVMSFEAASMAASITSDTVDLRGSVGYSVEFSWSGSSPVGTFSVQGSNSGIAWNSIYTAAISGASGAGLLNVERAMYSYARVSYTRASGTGNLSAVLNSKWG